MISLLLVPLSDPNISHINSEKMILLLLLSVSTSSLFGHPTPTHSHGTSEALCRSLKMLRLSLKDARNHHSLCVDSKRKTDCTTASLEVLKKCLDGGSEFDGECLEEAHMNLLTEDNKACFCGGLVEFHEMLNSVEALLCMKDANVHANEEEKRQGNADYNGNVLTMADFSANVHANEEEKRQGNADYNGYNIAFSANRADSCCLVSNSRVRFETTLTSTGGGWNGRAGVFTAPESGTYYFSRNTVSPSNEELQVFLMLNGEEKANCYAEEKGRASCSGSIVLTLRREDVVNLRIERGQMFEDQDQISFNSFTGHLIF